MSTDTKMAEAISFAQISDPKASYRESNVETVLLPAAALTAILDEVRHQEERHSALEERINSLEGDLRKYKLFSLGLRVDDLWEWVEDLDCRIHHIKPKDVRPSISTQRLIDKILEALHKKENATQYLTYSQIAKLLDVSPGGVCQLRVAIKSDGRLTISEHPANHKVRIVTLNPVWGKK